MFVGDVGHVAQDRKDDKPGEEASDGVADGYDDGVSVTVPLELVVGGESDDTATGLESTMKHLVREE